MDNGQKSKLRISQSLMRDWFKCRYRFKLVHADRLVRRRPTRPLQVGSLVHSGLEAALLCHVNAYPEAPISEYYDAIRWSIESAQKEFESSIEAFIDDDWRAEAQARMEEAVIITGRTIEWLRLPYDDCMWETLRLPDGTPLIEHEMLETSQPEFDVGGALDWVARRRDTGAIYLVDFKTRDSIQQPEFDARQIQAPIYLWLLRTKHDLHLTGTATIQIRRAVPEEPNINKTKKKHESRPGMSRGPCKTDWETYKAALLRHGYNVEDYLDMKEKLKPFFSISYEPRTMTEINNTIIDVFDTGQEIAAFLRDCGLDPHIRPVRARYPMNCNGCDMEPLCTAELYGHDADFLRKSEYMNADNPEFISVDFEEDENATLA